MTLCRASGGVNVCDRPCHTQRKTCLHAPKLSDAACRRVLSTSVAATGCAVSKRGWRPCSYYSSTLSSANDDVCRAKLAAFARSILAKRLRRLSRRRVTEFINSSSSSACQRRALTQDRRHRRPSKTMQSAQCISRSCGASSRRSVAVPLLELIEPMSSIGSSTGNLVDIVSDRSDWRLDCSPRSQSDFLLNFRLSFLVRSSLPLLNQFPHLPLPIAFSFLSNFAGNLKYELTKSFKDHGDFERRCHYKEQFTKSRAVQ